jgi:hypothetical protein
VIENRRICIWLIILSFMRFFATLSPASGAQWMLTAVDFQECVRSAVVLHTPAGLDRRRALDKSNLIKNILDPIGLSFCQALIF